MKKCRYFAVIIAVMLMTTWILSGCGNQQNNSSQKDGGNAAVNETQDVKKEYNGLDISNKAHVVLYGGGADSPDQAEVFTKLNSMLEKDLNMEIEIRHIGWADYFNKIMVMASTGEDFDGFMMWDGNAGAAGDFIRKPGLLKDLTDIIEKYGPQIIEVVGRDVYEDSKINGRAMRIPELNYVITRVMLYRNDLLEEIGMDVPKTFEEFEDMLYAAKAKYPELIPLCTGGTYMISMDMLKPQIAWAYGIGTQANMSFVFDDSSNKLVPWFAHPKAKDMLAKLNQWYKDGIVEKDFAVRKESFNGETIAIGKAFAEAQNGYYSNIDSTLKKIVPTGDIGFIYDLKDVSGQRYMQRLSVPYFNALYVLNSSENAERIVAFYDWLYSDRERYELFVYGEKDKHWIPKGEDQYELPEGVSTDALPYDPQSFEWLVHQDKLGRINATSDKEYNWRKSWVSLADNLIFEYADTAGFYEDTSKFADKLPTMKKLEDDYIDAIIIGAKPLSSLDELVEKWNAVTEGQYVEEMTRQYLEWKDSKGK